MLLSSIFWPLLVSQPVVGGDGVNLSTPPEILSIQERQAVASRDRERFELRARAALAAAEKRLFTYEASVFLDRQDIDLAARSLAESLFSPDLQSFRDRPEVEKLLLEMMERLERFHGIAPDAQKVYAIESLDRELEAAFLELSQSDEYIDSRERFFWAAPKAGIPTAIGLNLLIYGTYVGMKYVIIPMPRNAMATYRWLRTNRLGWDLVVRTSNTALQSYRNFRQERRLSRDLRRARRQGDRELARSCAVDLRKLRDTGVDPSTEDEDPSKPTWRRRTLLALGRIGIWLGVDTVVGIGIGYGYHRFFYEKLEAWDTQEDFMEDEWTPWIEDFRRMHSK